MCISGHFFYVCVLTPTHMPVCFLARWSRNPIFCKISTNLTGTAHTAFYADALAHAGKAPEFVSVDHTRLCFPFLSFNEYAMPERKAATEIIYGGNAQVPLSVHGIPVNPRHFHVTNSNRTPR